MTGLSDALLIAGLSAALNGAVVWGVVKTKLHYMEKGIEDAKGRADKAHDHADAAHQRLNGFFERRAEHG